MVQVRRAVESDCAGIAAVQVDSYRTAYAPFFPVDYIEHFTYAEQTQDWLDLFNAGMPDILLVAVTPEEQVLGYTLARAKADIPGYAAEIVAMHVRPDSKQQGIGTQLLRAVVEKLQELGCQSAMLWTLQGNPARRWYEKLGGTLITEKTDWLDDWPVTEVAYGWSDILALARATGAGKV